MPIYKVTRDAMVRLKTGTFADFGIREREDLQRLLRENIAVIAPDILVISEEFGDWRDSQRRIDLLGVDSDGNLVVVELKRDEIGGHMELQALRYAAMASTLTFDKAVQAYERFLESIGSELNAEESLLNFLGWEEVDEDAFAQDVRVILASADFSKEITSTVIWLNEHGLDIKCVRLRPVSMDQELLLDVQQIIPLPEAEEFQVQLRDKSRAEKQSRAQGRDLTKYDVTVNDKVLPRLAKRQAIRTIISALIDHGVSIEAIRAAIPWRKDRWFRSFDKELEPEELKEALLQQMAEDGIKPEARRFFIDEGSYFVIDGKTYCLTKMWGRKTERAMTALVERYPDGGISFQKHKE